MSEQPHFNKNPNAVTASRNSSKERANSYRRVLEKRNILRKTLVSTIKVSTNINIKYDATKYFAWADKQLKSRGLRGGIQRLKGVHHSALNYALKQPDPQIPFLATQNGFPRCIKYLKKYTKTVEGIQAMNSLLSYYRNIKLPIEPDFSSITNDGPEPSDIVVAEICNNIPKEWHFDVSDLSVPKLRFRAKGGPNGPATLCSALDIVALRNDETVLNNLREYLEIVEADDIVDIMEELIDIVEDEDNTTHSQLAVKQEGGGKSRVFAIVDAWTQAALEPLHHKCMSLLKDIPQDCTFNQDKRIPMLKHWTNIRNDIDCCDLSSATDRFHIKVLRKMLETMTGDEDFATAWANLIARRKFRYKGKSYEWQVGQPLGSYSSWAIFTLAHHLIMMTALNRIPRDIRLQSDYTMLGDDNAMVGKELSTNYREIMDSLGVQISDTKSMSGVAIEFAKRHFYRGKEVSAVPINHIASFCENYMLGPELIRQVQQRSSLVNSVNSIETMIEACGLNSTDANHLRILLGNPVTGVLLSTAYTECWEVPNVGQDNRPWMESIYSLIKYSYLIREYSLLQGGEEEFVSKLRSVPLPGFKQDHPELHPFQITLIEKYASAKSKAHASIGSFWSKSQLTRDVLPTVPRLSIDLLTRNYLTRTVHKSRLILLYHKKLKSLVRMENHALTKIKTLLPKESWANLALRRRIRKRLTAEYFNAERQSRIKG